MTIGMFLLFLVLGVVVAGLAGYGVRSYLGRVKLSSAEAQSQRIIQDSIRDAEAKRRELLLEAKDQLIKEKNQFEKEMRERRTGLAEHAEADAADRIRQPVGVALAPPAHGQLDGNQQQKDGGGKDDDLAGAHGGH